MDWKKLKVIFFALVLCLNAHAQTSTHQQFMDSLIGEIKNTPIDSSRVILLENIGFDYSTLNPDKGLEYAIQANQLAKKLGLKKREASTLAVIAINLSAKSEYEKAIEYNKRAIKLYNSIGYSLGTAGVSANQSQIYLKLANYPKALECNFKALGIYSQHKVHRNKAIVLENNGNIYYELKDYSKSIKNYKEALTIFKQHSTKSDVARCLGNMSRVSMDKGNFQEAINYLNEAFKINEIDGNPNSKMINLSNLGNVYYRQNKHEQALHYFKESLKLSDSINQKDYFAINKGNLGETYLSLFKESDNKNIALLNLAILHLKDAIYRCELIGLNAPKIEFTERLIEAYSFKKEYKSALELLEKNVFWKDSLYSIKSKQELAKIELTREKELKDKDIIIKNKELEITKLNSQKKTLFYSLAIFLLLLTLFLAYRYFRQKEKKHNKIIADIKQVQSHEIRGPIATILGLSSLLKDKDRDEDSKHEIIEGIEEMASQLDKKVVEIIKNSKI